MDKSKIRELISYIEKTKALDFKIERSDLMRETDYTKNLYFKLLAVLLIQGDEIQPGQKNLFERLIAGANCDYEMHDYICQALNIEIDEYVEFMKQNKETELRYAFVLDALLLITINGIQDEQLILAAHYIEALKIENASVKYLCKLTKAILEQDAVQYMYCDSIRPNNVSNIIGKNYITEDIEPGIWKNGSEILLYATELSVVDDRLLDEIVKSDYSVVHMKNISVKPFQHKFLFKNHKKIIFENCFFDSNEAINIVNCDEVEIIGCRFCDFSFRVFQVMDVPKILMKDTSFENCILSCDKYKSWECSACVIFSDGKSEITYVENCIFENCRVENRGAGAPSYILLNRVSSVKKSKIINCTGIYYFTNGDGYKAEDSKLFGETSVNNECVIKDSCKFC